MHILIALALAIFGAWFAWELWKVDRENRAKAAAAEKPDDDAMARRIAGMQPTAAPQAPPPRPGGAEEAEALRAAGEKLADSVRAEIISDTVERQPRSPAPPPAEPQGPPPIVIETIRYLAPSANDIADNRAIARHLGISEDEAWRLPPDAYANAGMELRYGKHWATGGRKRASDRAPPAPNARIEYAAASGEETARDITALRLREAEEATENGPSIMAWCHSRGARRTFLVERIHSLTDLATGEVLAGRAAIVTWMRERAAQHKAAERKLSRR